MHSINFTVELEIIPFSILVFFNEKDSNVEVILKEEGLDQSEIECITNLKDEEKGRAMMSRNNTTVIRIKYIPEDILHGVIAHESLHAVSMIMDHIGVVLNPNYSEEIYAYTLEFVVNKIHKELKGRLIS